MYALSYYLALKKCSKSFGYSSVIFKKYIGHLSSQKPLVRIIRESVFSDLSACPRDEKVLVLFLVRS